MCIALCRGLFWIWIDDNIRWKVTAHRLGYSADDGVARCRSSCILTLSSVTPFRFWNGVSICNNSKIISTSGICRQVDFNGKKYAANFRSRSNVAVLKLSRFLDLEWRCYYYFRFLSAILIFGRGRCRPLSLEVTCMRLDWWRHFGLGATSVSLTMG